MAHAGSLSLGNWHTRPTIPVLWHPLGIDCRPPLTVAHRRLLLPTSHLIGKEEGLNNVERSKTNYAT